MSRTQATPNFFVKVGSLDNRVAALERASSITTFPDIDTAGLTSAQIDAAIFSGTAQIPASGVFATDSTNHFLLVRIGGHWAKTTLTLI